MLRRRRHRVIGAGRSEGYAMRRFLATALFCVAEGLGGCAETARQVQLPPDEPRPPAALQPVSTAPGAAASAPLPPDPGCLATFDGDFRGSFDRCIVTAEFIASTQATNFTITLQGQGALKTFTFFAVLRSLAPITYGPNDVSSAFGSLGASGADWAYGTSGIGELKSLVLTRVGPPRRTIIGQEWTALDGTLDLVLHSATGRPEVTLHVAF
jgi:hypothetical protein